MTVDLYAELALAVRGLRETTLRRKGYLAAHGVSCGLVGLIHARTEGEALFVPDGEGEAFYAFGALAVHHHCLGACVPPRSIDGRSVALLDLAAWRPSEPDRVRLRVGNVIALGEWQLAPFGDDDSPLRLWSTPLAWAASSFDGAVVVDWDAASADLIHRREIVTDTLELGERLRSELLKARRRMLPPMPKISVTVDATKAA